MPPVAHDVYDHALKLLWKHDPEGLVQLDPVASGSQVGAWIGGDVVQSLRRAADGAREMVGPYGPYVFHPEFESACTPEVAERMLEYNQLVRLAVGGRPVVRSVLYLLRPPRGRISNRLDIRYGPVEIVRFRFEIVRLYQIPAMDLASDPRLAPLAPLGARFGRATLPVLRQAVHRIHTSTDRARLERLNVLSMLTLAAGVSRTTIDAMIEESEVRMALSYQDIYQEGIETGIQRGERTATLRVVSQIVQLRFPDRAGELLAHLTRLPDLSRVAELLLTAPDADTVLQRVDQSPVS